MYKHIATFGVAVAIFGIFNKDSRFYRFLLIVLTNPRKF